MTFNELTLQYLDEILEGIQGVRNLIAGGGVPENEDWLKAAVPMSEIINIVGNYRMLKDKEVGKEYELYEIDGRLLFRKKSSEE